MVRKFTIFALFYFVFDGKSWGDLTEGFLRYNFGGLIHGGAYFQNFTVAVVLCSRHCSLPSQHFFIGYLIIAP